MSSLCRKCFWRSMKIFFLSLRKWNVFWAKKKTPALSRLLESAKDERIKIHPWCHLDSQYDLCTLRNTCIFPATDVCPTSQNTKHDAFHCALRGPFGSLHLDPALTLLDSLCAHVLLWSPLQRFIVLNSFLSLPHFFPMSTIHFIKHDRLIPDRKLHNRFFSAS